MHSGPVTRLRITNDDAYLFSVSEDSTVFICDVRDKEARHMTLDILMTQHYRASAAAVAYE